MSLHTAFFYLVLLFQISCGNKSKNEDREKKVERKEAKIVQTQTPGNCLSPEEEKKYDFSQELVNPQVWSKESGIVNKLDQLHIHPTPDATEIMDALQGIFQKYFVEATGTTPWQPQNHLKFTQLLHAIPWN